MNACSMRRLASASVGEHLQPGAGADHVVGQRQHDAAGVAVVGHLVAGAVPQDAADLGAVGRVGRQAVGVGPVAAVVVGGHGRVVAGRRAAAPQRRRAPRLRGENSRLAASSARSVGSRWNELVEHAGRDAWTWPPLSRPGTCRPRSGRSACAARRCPRRQRPWPVLGRFRGSCLSRSSAIEVSPVRRVGREAIGGLPIWLNATRLTDADVDAKRVRAEIRERSCYI